MQKSQPLIINVFCSDELLFDWVKLTLQLSQLIVNKINFVSAATKTLPDPNSEKADLFIVLEADAPKFMKKIKDQYFGQISCPILLLTESFEQYKKPAKLNLNIDSLPLQIITFNLIEHAVSSLLRDFSQTTKLTKLAHYDPLTGAANRLLFEDRLNEGLKRVKRFKEPLSLVYFDLDEFKPVNDTYGHEVGDLLLKKFVSVVKSIVRETDTFARMGGDEFALIVTNAGKDNVSQVCQKIKKALESKHHFNGASIQIQVSIGVASMTPEKHNKLIAQQLLKYSDKAVYKAKKIKGTAIEFANLDEPL